MAVIETVETATLTACLTLRNQRLNSSSWVERRQVSGEEQVNIYFRNDPMKYDLICGITSQNSK